MEDLTPKGYVGIARDTELDFEHAVLVMRELAKFHAVSLAFKDQKPKLFDETVGKLQVKWKIVSITLIKSFEDK